MEAAQKDGFPHGKHEGVSNFRGAEYGCDGDVGKTEEAAFSLWSIKGYPKVSNTSKDKHLPERIEDAMILVMSSGLYKAWVMVNYQAGGYLRTKVLVVLYPQRDFYSKKKEEHRVQLEYIYAIVAPWGIVC